MTASDRLALAARLRELEQQATPGDWRTKANSSGGVLWLRGSEIGPNRHDQSHVQIVPSSDAELICELRNHLPLILRALEGK